MNNFFRNFLASLLPRLASQPAMDATPVPHAANANPFSLDHECYADSRHFLQNKPLLRHIASQLETLKSQHADGDDACAAFANSLDRTDISREETLEVEPLVALPDVAAIASRECGRFMPITESGVVVSLFMWSADVFCLPWIYRDMSRSIISTETSHRMTAKSSAVR